MISRTITTPTAVAALVAALVLTGCNGSSDDPQPTLTTTNPPAATTSAPAATTEAPDDAVQTTTETELSPEEQDKADVEETVQAYSNALDQAMIGEASIEGIYPFSRDAAREKWVTQVMAYQAQDITFSGQSELEVLELSVDGDTAEVMACADVSDVEAVDANGDSFITEDRLDQTTKDFVLERDSSAEFGWYIVEDTNRNEPCDD